MAPLQRPRTHGHAPVVRTNGTSPMAMHPPSIDHRMCASNALTTAAMPPLCTFRADVPGLQTSGSCRVSDPGDSAHLGSAVAPRRDFATLRPSAKRREPSPCALSACTKPHKSKAAREKGAAGSKPAARSGSDSIHTLSLLFLCAAFQFTVTRASPSTMLVHAGQRWDAQIGRAHV